MKHEPIELTTSPDAIMAQLTRKIWDVLLGDDEAEKESMLTLVETQLGINARLNVQEVIEAIKKGEVKRP